MAQVLPFLSKVPIFWGSVLFCSHALLILSADDFGRFLWDPVEVAQNFRRDYHQTFVQPDFRAEKKKPSLEVFYLFSCVSGRKRPPKNLRQTLVTSGTRVSLVKVLPKKLSVDMGLLVSQHRNQSAPKSQRFLRFAIAMPIADPRNRAISETREGNVALRFKP